jgi:hypothetical protein
MSTEINISEIMRLLREGKLYSLKVGKTMERHKTKNGFKRYPRFFIRLPTKFIKTFGLKEGDIFYAIPQKLLDIIDHKYHNERCFINVCSMLHECSNIDNNHFLRYTSRIEPMESMISKNPIVSKDNSVGRLEKIVEAKPVIIRAKDKEYKKARIVIDLPPEYIGKKFRLIEV